MAWKHLAQLAAFGYAVAIVYLNVVGAWDYRGAMSVEHGWPLIYMRRAGVYVPSSPSEFTSDLDATTLKSLACGQRCDLGILTRNAFVQPGGRYRRVYGCEPRNSGLCPSSGDVGQVKYTYERDTR